MSKRRDSFSNFPKTKPRSSPAQTISWLHLSDLHLGALHADNKSVIIETLLNDIKESCLNVERRPDLIVIAGDVTLNGQVEEYVYAQDFFDRLLRVTELTKDRLFIVPGNHDIDRTKFSSSRSHLASDLTDRHNLDEYLSNDSERAVLRERLNNYQTFIKNYFGREPSITEDFSYTNILEVAGLHIAMIGLNSAWFSGSGNDHGRLILGERQVREALVKAEAADLRVAIVHHSFDWLKNFDRAVVEPLLLGGCDFILHGHTHDAGLLQAQTHEREAIIIPAGLYHDPRQAEFSYNFVALDFSSRKGNIFPRSFSEQRMHWAKDVISYLNAPDGVYTFQLPDRLSSSPATLPEIFVDGNQRAQEIRVFLSYAREDAQQVERLYQRLKEAGFKPWMDTKDIFPGESWEISTSRAITASHFFLSCLSANSVNRRGYFQQEIKMAMDVWSRMLESDIFLVPVRLDDCVIPQPLKHYRTADLFRDDGLTNLIQSIQTGMKRRGVRIDLPTGTGESTTGQEGSIPDGLKLQCTLRGHTETITRIAWSPDGTMLASPSLDLIIRLWSLPPGELEQELKGHTCGIYSLAWAPDSKRIASGSDKGRVRVWDVTSGQLLTTLTGHHGRIECLDWSPDGQFLAAASADSTVSLWSMINFKQTLVYDAHLAWVNGVAWSPDGRHLASGAEDNTIRIWDSQTGETLWTLSGHADWISEVRWSHDGRFIASASNDETIRIWDPIEGAPVQALQGHTDFVKSISFSSDDRLLASKSDDNTVRLWRCDSWEPVATLPEPTGTDLNPTPSVSFHPSEPLLATLGENDMVIRIWEVSFHRLLGAAVSESVQYVNAKVVLVGEGSVGKSGLGYRIAEKEFRPTSPTHGAQFWQIPIAHAPNLPPNLKGEITLWDLAGQQDYHLVHVLFLDDLSAALLLFDCSDSGSPFRGVPYWAKVLRQRAPEGAFKLLISSRIDICPITVDQRAINRVLGEYELDDYVSTSARNGVGVDVLTEKLIQGIDWNKLPRTTTPRLFQIIRNFLLAQKAKKNTLINMRGVWNEVRDHAGGEEPTREEVNTVVSLLQSQGLVHRVDPTPNESFVLLRPELINQYASSIIQAARTNLQGIGAVSEHEAVKAKLTFSGVDRLNWLEERIILESVVELLITSELCFREVGMLVFPSQINVTRPIPVEEHPRTEITYTFSGSIETIFASLVVRLNHSEYFERVDQWKYAAEFSRNGCILGFSMLQQKEESGELEIYFQSGVTEFDRVLFIRFITDHLHSKGVDIDERIRLYCPKCDKEITDRDAVAARTLAGKLDIPCQHCPDNVMVMIPRNIEEHYRSNTSYAAKHEEITEAVDKRTQEEAEAFKADQRQYSQARNNLIHILHLSDLHLGTSEDARKYRTQLETDLKRELEIYHLEYLVISGDIADRSTPEEYKAAFELVDGLAKRFGLDHSRIVIVPGNHDLNWDLSAESYGYIPQHKLPNELTTEYISAAGVGALQRDPNSYRQRFTHFSAHFYKKIYGGGAQYPTEYGDQGILQLMPNDRLVFLGLNSSWDIDHHYRKRASVNMQALSKALDQLQDDKFDSWLKIAVWHHPVTGQDMMNDDFLQLLAANRFQICMHGHIHEAKQGFYSYDSDRGIHIIGAGTFGAPAKEQVPGIPLQYNLVALDRESFSITVHTRKKEKPDGAWYADARWGSKKAPEPQYVINLEN